MLHVVFPILDLCFNPYGEKKYCFSQSIDYKRTRLAFFSSVFFYPELYLLNMCKCVG